MEINIYLTSWFQTFAVIWILYIFFWVFPRCQIVAGRRFGTLYQFHLQRLGEQCEVWEEARYFIWKTHKTGPTEKISSGRAQLQLWPYHKTTRYQTTLRKNRLLRSPHQGGHWNRDASEQHEQGRWPDSQLCLEASSLHTLKEKRDKHTTQNNPTVTWHASFIPPSSTPTHLPWTAHYLMPPFPIGPVSSS